MSRQRNRGSDTKPFHIIRRLLTVDFVAIKLLYRERRHGIPGTEQNIDIVEEALEAAIDRRLLRTCPADLFGRHLQGRFDVAGHVRT